MQLLYRTAAKLTERQFDCMTIEEFIATGKTITFAGNGVDFDALRLQALDLVPYSSARHTKFRSNLFPGMRVAVLQFFQYCERLLH
jgi:hypothetical protein